MKLCLTPGYFLLVFGALLGKQEGRNIELFNSFELQWDQIDNDAVINMDYYKAKEEQCKFCSTTAFYFLCKP